MNTRFSLRFLLCVTVIPCLAESAATSPDKPESDGFGDTSAIRVESKKTGGLRVPKSMDEIVFFNADHSPTGAYADFVYGAEGSGGLVQGKPVIPHDGVIAGIVGEGLMPFLPKSAGDVPRLDKKTVMRTLLAATDSWTAPGFKWTHYSPLRALADFKMADDEKRKKFLLPATWMKFELDNTSGTRSKTLVFGLPVTGARRAFASGTLEGFAFGAHALAVRAGSCDLWTDDSVKAKLGLKGGSVFALTAAPGERRELVVLVGHYDDTPLERDAPLGDATRKMVAGQPKDGSVVRGTKYQYTRYFRSIDDVLKYANDDYADAVDQCSMLDKKLEAAGLDPFRRFLAAHSLNTYRFNTIAMTDADGTLLWAEPEGAYVWINTLDLLADHAFIQLELFPWVTRNILDQFADRHAYRQPLIDPESGKKYPAPQLSFSHDMGRELRWSTPGRSGYEYHYRVSMAQEELQNWLLCSGLYWKKTGDLAWLRSREKLLDESLDSMLARDDANPAKRDGVTSLETRPAEWGAENTTYDALDHALKLSRNNTYITVKSWATYLALEAMFDALGDRDRAATSRDQAGKAARTVVAARNADKTLPAILDGQNTSRVIPVVEALVYPEQMGLKSAIAFDGPYGALIVALRDHLNAVLKRGICLDAKSGAWKLSSTSNNTWQSKVYLSQHVAEAILGLKGDAISGPVDAVHAAFQSRAADNCWSEQLRSSDGGVLGGLHYPRGVTSALWWLATPAGTK